MSGEITTNAPTPIKITMLSFNKTISINTSGLVFREIYNPKFESYDAIANVNVDLNTFKNMFCFQSDYIDVNDITETDIKYYVLENKTNYFIPSLGSSIVNTNPIVAFTPSATIESNQVIGNDFTRYLAYLLFNTPYGTDLFINETQLVNSVSSSLYTAWSSCLSDLRNVSNESNNPDIPLLGNSSAKYLTNDYSNVRNICRELFLQLISKAPSRFTNLQQIPLEDEDSAPIREALNLNYYYLPFVNNDIIQLRVKVLPNNDQPTFGITSTTDPTKFENVGDDMRLKGRSYIINMVLTDNLSATTRFTGKVSIKVVGKTSTLSSLDYLPIIQNDNILNINTKTTQINLNTIQTDIYYDFDTTRVSSTNSILDVGFGFSNDAVTFYNANIQSIEVLEFGGIPLYGKGSQFKGLLSDIIFSASDVPVVSPNTSLEYAFSSMTTFNKNVNFLNNWNLLNVISMNSMFSGCSIFNNGSLTDDGLRPMSFATSSSLQNISYLFNNCPKFNQTVSFSNTMGVTDMMYMFSECSIFNNGSLTDDGLHPISFETSSSLQNLNGTFRYNSKFNQTVYISNMTGVTDMTRMLTYCTIFNNGSITNDGLHPMSFATSSSLQLLIATFAYSLKFNQTVSFTDTTCVTDMSRLFQSGNRFNNGSVTNDGLHPLSFTTSSSLNFTYYMFFGCNQFNQTLSITNMNNVTNVHIMFQYCYVLNKKLLLGDQTPDGSGNVWQINLPSVITMAGLFYLCSAFNNGETTNTGAIPLKIRTSSALTSLHKLFQQTNFNQPVTISNTTGVTDITNMFYQAVRFNQSIAIGDQTPDGSGNVWQINLPSVISLASAFSGCSAFNNGETTNTGAIPLKIRTGSALTSLASVFLSCVKFNQSITIQNISNVTTMASAFAGCSLFNNGYGSGNTSNVLFPVKPLVTTITTTFGTGSLLATGNKPTWMTTLWVVI
jgi:hypothetical protein